MRDLLFLSHRIPFPPDKGDKIRSYNILRHLASNFRIHLGCFYDDGADSRHVSHLRELCTDVFCIPLTRTHKLVRAGFAALAGGSLSAACYRDASMTCWVRSKLDDDNIADIFVFSSAMAPYVLDHARTKHIIVDMVDVDSMKWGAYAKSALWPLNLIYGREQKELFLLERRTAATCDLSLFVSDEEAALFSRLAPETKQRVRCVENGVDADYFDPALGLPDPFFGDNPRIVFIGAMNYHPNVDAVSWFAHAVLPEIRRQHSAAEFWIVGSNPVARVRRLARQSGVHVTGTVPDVRPFLAHASCAVAPLRIARGIQNKVLEAMAMGNAVVATREACEGLTAVSGRDLLIADGALGLADHVCQVLDGRRREIGPAARAWVKAECRWSDKLARLDPMLPEHATSNDAMSPRAFKSFGEFV